jgi:YidC/Oxa1 family membrane protein insertase
LYPAPPQDAGTPATAPSPERSETVTSAPPPPTEPVTPPVAPAKAETVTVETDLYSARIDTAGGRLTSLRLKKYRTAVVAESEPLEMIQVGPNAAYPLGVRLASDDGKSVQDDTQVVYAVERRNVAVADSASDAVVLRGTLPSGAEIEKRIGFTGNAYPIELAIKVKGAPAPLTRVGVGWRHQLPEVVSGDPEAHYRGIAILTDKKVVHELATSLAGSPPKTYDPPIRWAGYADHYFVAALIPADPSQARAVVSAENGGVQLLLTSPRASDGSSTEFTLYVGPKDIAVLEASGHDLARAVDFGWFSFLAVPLLRLLKLFHTVTRNYGIDIILLTILIKVLFIPLTNRSMKSMRDMQRLQPQMAKLREKYKDDREQLNKEMIELYRRHRVNPLGGCLPMLLQFPVFIGLYQALSQAIDLRHAKFGLWVHDLSAHECYPWPGQGTAIGCNDFSVLGVPIPILVLLMGSSMILQQYLSPSSGMDPAQQRMMMILMPVMFTVMFINFPSGLVLYWLVNNVLTIGQQWWSNREPAPAK